MSRPIGIGVMSLAIAGAIAAAADDNVIMAALSLAAAMLVVWRCP